MHAYAQGLGSTLMPPEVGGGSERPCGLAPPSHPFRLASSGQKPKDEVFIGKQLAYHFTNRNVLGKLQKCSWKILKCSWTVEKWDPISDPNLEPQEQARVETFGPPFWDPFRLLAVLKFLLDGPRAVQQLSLIHI